MRILLKLFVLVLSCAPLVAAQLQTVRVGYFKGVPFLAPVIIKEMGWDKKEGLDMQLTYFTGPQLVVQAFAAGELDAMYNNPTSVFPLPERNVPVQILSATTKDSFFIIQNMRLKTAAKLSIAELIKRFSAENGRKVRLGVIAKGAITDVLARIWLEGEGNSAAPYIELVNVGGFDQMQQLLASGALDMACLPEPLYTIAYRQQPGWTVCVLPTQLLKNHISGVLVAHRDFVKNKPDIAEKLIVLQIRAAQFLSEYPNKAAECVARQKSLGMIAPDVWESAIRAAGPTFFTDIRQLMPSARFMYDYMRKNGYLNSDQNIETMFSTQAYEKAYAKAVEK